MDSGILMIQDSILVCSPDPRILHTAHVRMFQVFLPGAFNPLLMANEKQAVASSTLQVATNGKGKLADLLAGSPSQGLGSCQPKQVTVPYAM
jgi:hypothetical protein